MSESVTENPTTFIADPGPLGLAAFALTTFVLSCGNAGLFGKTGGAVVLPLALFYGGIAQVLAGMWEFKKNNTFGALAFTSYGAFWLSFAAFVKFVIPDIIKNDSAQIGHSVGLFLLAWTIFTAYMLVGTFRVNGALVAVFAVLFITFAVLTYGNYEDKINIVKIGGYLGILTALLAWYASAAGMLAATWKKQVLPVFPLAK